MLTDERIEELILAGGGRWHDKSFWKIEDADLHPTARAIEAEVRKDALEEAAAVAEKATYRKRWVTAGINGQAGKVPPCAVAAAIRTRGKP